MYSSMKRGRLNPIPIAKTAPPGDPIPAQIELDYNARKRALEESGGCAEMPFFGLFILFALSHIIVCFVFIFLPEVDYSDCTQNEFGQNVSGVGTFAQFRDRPEVVSVMILLLPVIAYLWFFITEMVPLIVCVGSIMVSAAAYIMLGTAVAIVNGKVDGPIETTILAIFLIAIGAGTIIFYIYTYKQVVETSRRLSVASGFLSRHFSVVLVTFGLEAILLTYLGFSVFAFVEISQQREITSNNGGVCFTVLPTRYQNLLYYLMFVTIWVLKFLSLLKLDVTASSVAAFFFNQWSASVPFTSLKNSVKLSTGVLSMSALIVTPIEYTIQELNKTTWWLNPFLWPLCIICCCASLILQPFTRFLVISHAITGRGFVASGRDMFLMLFDNFVGAYVNDWLSSLVVTSSSKVFSISLAFATWGWLDAGPERLNTLQFIFTEGDDAETSFLIFVGMVYMMFYFLARPVTLLILLVLIDPFVEDMTGYLVESGGEELAGIFLSFLGALFIGSLASIVFHFQGELLLHSIDTLFVCGALSDNIPKSMKTFYVVADTSFVKEGTLISKALSGSSSGGASIGGAAGRSRSRSNSKGRLARKV